MGSNVTAAYRAYKKGAFFANPCFTQIHPTCIPVSGDYQSKLTLMSESLRNDGRVWVPKNNGDKRPPQEIPEEERDYYLERKYPGFGNLAPRDVASRSAKEVCDKGRGIGTSGYGVYLDFADSIKRLGENVIRERYGNLFEQRALDLIPALRAEFWENVRVPGSGTALNQELEKAGRVADYLEFGELMARDALHHNES